MISATGDSLAEAAGTSLTAIVNTMRKTNPRPADASTDPMIARGTVRVASEASSDMFAAVSKPTRVLKPMSVAAIRPPPTAK